MFGSIKKVVTISENIWWQVLASPFKYIVTLLNYFSCLVAGAPWSEQAKLQQKLIVSVEAIATHLICWGLPSMWRPKVSILVATLGLYSDDDQLHQSLLVLLVSDCYTTFHRQKLEYTATG